MVDETKRKTRQLEDKSGKRNREIKANHEIKKNKNGSRKRNESSKGDKGRDHYRELVFSYSRWDTKRICLFFRDIRNKDKPTFYCQRGTGSGRGAYYC